MACGRSMPQWNDCRFTTWISTRLIAKPSTRPTASPMPLTRSPSLASIVGDLPPRDTDVAQHAELALPREHQRAERRRQSDQPDRDRGGEQAIGDRERAVEHAQRDRADLARRREREAATRREGARRAARAAAIDRDARCEPQRGVRRARYRRSCARTRRAAITRAPVAVRSRATHPRRRSAAACPASGSAIVVPVRSP